MGLLIHKNILGAIAKCTENTKQKFQITRKAFESILLYGEKA